MFELYDRDREEVVAIVETKKGAISLASKVLKEQPRRTLRDLVVRLKVEPSVRIFYMKVFKPKSK